MSLRESGAGLHGLHHGLSEKQAEKSRRAHGTNALSKRPKVPFYKKYVETFADPIIRILLIALGINVVFIFSDAYSWVEPAGIGIAVVLSTLVSAISEHGSESAFERLQEEAARVFCKVRRSGSLVELPIDEIVVGDIVLLQTGDLIPADGAVIAGRLGVDQSPLNGESKEADKHPGAQSGRADDFMSPGRLFRGCIVTGGEATMRVDTVGDRTVYGALAREIQHEKRESPLRLRLTHLAGTVSKLGYLGAAAVTVSYLFFNLVIENAFSLPLILASLSSLPRVLDTLMNCAMLAVSVIVMAVPEGLPMMITVVLSANMKRMLKDNVLVRKLTGIETAGSLNMLFTDKTGTLTMGKLRVGAFIDAEGKRYTFDELSAHKGLYNLAVASMVYNNAATMTGAFPKRRAIGSNATDRAMLEFAEALACDFRELKTSDQIYFDSEKKFSSVCVRGGIHKTLIKGAPEKLLQKCTQYVSNTGECLALEAAKRKNLERTVGLLGAQAVRLVALCMGPPAGGQQLPAEMAFIGLVGLRDQIRPEAAEGVARARRAGIQVVMITGDSRETAVAIAQETGIMRRGEIAVTSDELGKMDDAAVEKLLPSLGVVARALPADKSRLVRLAQGQGKVVGMTGDGINDAPALKRADVGFAMGSGTEIAKDAGDIVILDDNFASIGNAILYGRTIFKSIRKFIIFQLTINFCAVSLAVIGPFVGVESPITVLQMLWINMVMDTLAGLAFSGEAPQPEYMDEAPKKREEPILNGYMVSQIVFTGMYSMLMCLLFLRLGVSRGLVRSTPGDGALLTAFFGLFMFTAIVNAFNARTHRYRLLSRLGSNKLFMGVMALVTAIQAAILYFGGEFFRTVPLLPGEMWVIVALALSVVPVDWLRKFLVRRTRNIPQSV